MLEKCQPCDVVTDEEYQKAPEKCVDIKPISRWTIVPQSAVGAVADLLYPRQCAGCGLWDCDLCDACAYEFYHPWKNVASTAPFLVCVCADTGQLREEFPCWALMPYRSRARSIIVTWKHSHSRSLDRAICTLWKHRLVQMRRILCADASNVCVVPAPSAWSRKHDGRLVAGKLAQSVAQCFHAQYCDYLYVNSDKGVFRSLYSCARSSGKYHVKKLQERSRKRYHIHSKKDFSGTSVIIVDDVLTSGATANAVAHAVREAGGTIIGMVVLACGRYDAISCQ